ncbi:MAG TPA: ABC transporter substrate-binding protein [Xanthobacteraceae bacterium]|nr:ABC transporter substrate-binding protein [Xanthobacteraceae bacterium]
MTRQTMLWGGLAAVLALVPATASADDLKSWRHGLLEAKSDAGFTMMAGLRGFAEKRGLKLDLLQVKSEPIALKALIAGELESYEGGPGSGIVAAARGADIRIVACAWPGFVHGVFAGPKVAKVEDIRGKAFATSAPGSLPDLLARAVLEKYKVPAGEVRFANIGSDNDRYKALDGGVVDAAILSAEFVPVAEHGIRLLLAGREVMPNFIRGCFMTTGAVLSQRRDDAVRFVAAEIEALRFAVAHRAEVAALTREVTKAKAGDPRPEFIFDEAIRHKDVDPEAPLPLDKLAWMQDQLIHAGSMPAPIDLAKLVDASVRAKAHELLR